MADVPITKYFRVEYMKKFAPEGRAIRKTRQTMGLGLRAFAEQVGCSPAYISRMETSQIEYVSLRLAERIASILARAKLGDLTGNGS